MNQDWNEVEALRESLREHMVEIHRLRAAGRHALEALEEYQQKGAPFMSCDAAVDALRAALAETTSQESRQVEPVAWLSEGGDVSRSKRYMDEMGFKCNPLYTAPPKREWVGLTLNESEDFYEKYSDRAELINAVDKFLKEKNHD